MWTVLQKYKSRQFYFPVKFCMGRVCVFIWPFLTKPFSHLVLLWSSGCILLRLLPPTIPITSQRSGRVTGWKKGLSFVIVNLLHQKTNFKQETRHLSTFRKNTWFHFFFVLQFFSILHIWNCQSFFVYSPEFLLQTFMLRKKSCEFGQRQMHLDRCAGLCILFKCKFYTLQLSLCGFYY